MRLTCPSCGAVASAEAWTNDADARAAMRIVSELPWSVSRMCLPYLTLFRLPGSGLKWTKALKLLADLQTLEKASHIQWEQKVARPNASLAWALGMERIIEHPPKTLPLKNHNYLRAVAYEIADEMDRQTEKKQIRAERSGSIKYYREPSKKEQHQASAPERISFDDMKQITEANYRKRKTSKPENDS